jgi:hypothetical protein
MSQFKDLNDKLREHEAATLRTSDIKLASEGEHSSRSPSALQSQQKHSDKRAVSSRAAHTAAHAPTNTTAKPQAKPLLMPKPKLTALKPAAQLKPKI